MGPSHRDEYSEGGMIDGVRGGYIGGLGLHPLIDDTAMEQLCYRTPGGCMGKQEEVFLIHQYSYLFRLTFYVTLTTQYSLRTGYHF